MPLAFSDLSTLLSRLESVEQRDPPILLAAEKKAQLHQITESWFRSHRRTINEASVATSVALLSALLPERRTDLVYDLQAPRLCRILSRTLRLSAIRTKELQAYTRPGLGDLAACLERVLQAGGPPAVPAVGLDEVDELLTFLAGFSRFSGPQIEKHDRASAGEKRDRLLANILLRLRPEEAKWLVRLILKDFSPVTIDEEHVLRAFHFLVPDLLKFQNNFYAAVELLKGSLREYPDHPDPRSGRLHKQSVAKSLRPAVGIKVGRPNFVKARSIDHCMNMLGKRSWVLERKYDGEYCEVHVDLEASADPTKCIRIFSKSGKDSTSDRKGIHSAICQSLRLGQQGCTIRRKAILLGELVGYSDRDNAILPFDEIRKHVSRSGLYIGTNEDAPPTADEHLAIVFFDLLLVDEESVMNRPIEERRSRLRQIYTKIPGRVMGAEWKIVDFNDGAKARKRLLEQFAASIAQRCEGLILKPCGVPYFSLDPSSNGQSLIKLKKDYIADMGDEADFAVIGASYNPQNALKRDFPGVKWSSFHLGCLTNKDDVLRFNTQPCFKFVGTISHDACVPKTVLIAANALGKFMAKQADSSDSAILPFDVESHGRPKMDVIFEQPFVFEVLGSGLEKPSNCNFLMLRHARVKKLHQDRTWKDCVSFQELQEMGTLARSAPVESESQETRSWIEKLERKCRRKAQRESTTSPTKSKAGSTPSAEGLLAAIQLSSPSDPVRGLGGIHSSAAAVPPAVLPAVPPAVPQLDGTTLVESQQRALVKRRADDVYETPCRPEKKFRFADTSAGSRPDQAIVIVDNESSNRPGVLSDITNTAPSRSMSAEKDSPVAAPQTPVISILPTPPMTKRLPPLSALPQLLDPNPPIVPLHHPSSPSYECTCSPDCLFTNAILYLSPCISNTPYVTDDLLSTHNIMLITSLTHWSRDSYAFPTLSDTEPESQAYPGERKIILVESRRRNAVAGIVEEILRLNGGVFRERVEVWDWRVLEVCGGHNVGFGEGTVRRWFVGASLVDEGRGETIFVWQREFKGA